MIKARNTARSILLATALGYVLAAGSLWSLQRRLIFEPSRVMSAAPSDFAYAVLETAIPVQAAPKAGRIYGWWVPGARADGPVVLYLHGNDGNVSTSMPEVAPLRQLGYSVLLIDYRGFGNSEGPFPSERSVYEDAEAAWRYLVGERNVRPERLYIYGHSLGGAVAIELATRHPEAAGLIVESSFTSIYEMARIERQYRLFPVKLFLNQKFDSLSKVARLRMPSLFIHGTDDEIVPLAMGERLYERAGGAKRFVAIPRGRHDTNAAAGGELFVSAIRNFVAQDQRGLNSSSM